jgi:hypothetical protein
MGDYYILDGHDVRPVPDVVTWAKWFEAHDRRVAFDMVGDGDARVEISTVFLGIDHNFGVGRVPILFETMVFGGPEDGYCDRYATWDEAVVGHAAAVVLATAIPD